MSFYINTIHLLKDPFFNNIYHDCIRKNLKSLNLSIT